MGEETGRESFRERLARSIDAAWRGWLRLREWALALKPCRVPILLVLGGIAFLLAGQGEDVARALAERSTLDPGAGWRTSWFFAAALAWSLSAWYWAGVMLRLKFPGVPGQARRLHKLRTWTPRLIGFVAAASVAASFLLAARGYAPDEHPDVRERLELYGFGSAAVAAGFLAFAWLRRRAANYAYAKLNVQFLKVPLEEEQVYGELGFKDLGATTRALLLAALAVAVVFFFVFLLAPLAAAPALGSAAIVLIAASGWIAVGSTLDFAGMRLHVPVFSFLLGVAVLCSCWNDNHEVRSLAARQPAERPDVRASLQSWMKQHRDKLRRPQDRVPLYVVDAEGGGIRAAYWTVTVLGEIQKRNPAFAAHLYSLSGVSGGSLGASVFVALLAQSREQKLDLKETAQAILSEDFLAPVVATLLYPDLVQRLWPWPVRSFDRAATLERSWERAWTEHVRQRARMSEPFDALWQGGGGWLPALLLNATWVETGKRVITSNLRIAAAKGAEDFVDAEDANAFFAAQGRSLPLATAAHLSARFTYVSPAGTLVKDGRPYGRVVDGGYFENSGATATREILETIDLLAKEDARWKQVDAYVIHISNEPVDTRYAADGLMQAPDNPRIQPRQFLNEALSPLWTLLNTRDARGTHSRESLMWKAGEDYFLHFGLCRASSGVPLGWVLSGSTRQRMEAQLLRTKCGDVFDNPGNLRKIGDQLARFAPG